MLTEPNARIEIWKSKRTWLSKTVNERQQILNHLESIVKANLPEADHFDAGPFLISKPWGFLLIWTLVLENDASEDYYTAFEIAECFEPIIHVTAKEKMTARWMASRVL